MKTRNTLAIILTLMTLTGSALAQEDALPPWEEWQPPEVQMPDPNAWAEAYGQRLWERHRAAMERSTEQ